MNDYMFLFRISPDAQREAIGTPERAQKTLQSWIDWITVLEKSGSLKNRGLPLEMGGRVVKKDLVTDGPFTEAKDVVNGFLVVSARDFDHAIELAASCPMILGGAGSVEVRPVMASLFPKSA